MAGTKAIVLGVGKLAAVAFALAATGYLVINAQRRANGPPSAATSTSLPAPHAPIAEPAAEPAAVVTPEATAVLVDEPVIDANAAVVDPTFMLSTKVGVFTEMNGSLLPAETEVAPAAPRVYLEGSKSLRLDVQRATPPPPAPGKP